MSANTLSAGLACLMALARSTRSCSSDEAIGMVDGDPPEGGPLVRGTGGGGVRVKEEVVDDGVEVRGWLPMAAASMAVSVMGPPAVRRSLKFGAKIKNVRGQDQNLAPKFLKFGAKIKNVCRRDRNLAPKLKTFLDGPKFGDGSDIWRQN
jgi:hypothetical protein